LLKTERVEQLDVGESADMRARLSAAEGKEARQRLPFTDWASPARSEEGGEKEGRAGRQGKKSRPSWAARAERREREKEFFFELIFKAHFQMIFKSFLV
jgi:hypothetical protein